MYIALVLFVLTLLVFLQAAILKLQDQWLLMVLSTILSILIVSIIFNPNYCENRTIISAEIFFISVLYSLVYYFLMNDSNYLELTVVLCLLFEIIFDETYCFNTKTTDPNQDEERHINNPTTKNDKLGSGL